MATVRKAVIPAAGFGTRFLPATKAMPKEMLPIVDKPIIQYVVEELVASGITDIAVVTGYAKRSIEDHFDVPSRELIENLRLGGESKQPFIDQVEQLAEMANFYYLRQKGPYGNGTPVLNAKDIIGDEWFVAIWGDEFIYANPPRVKQMIEVWEKHQKPVISAVRINDRQALSKYGIADVTDVEPGVFRINRIVEKPSPDEAPSNLATHGAYLMPPRLFDLLEKTERGKGGEVWLIDGINALMEEEDVYAVEIQNGQYYDTGNKLEYLKTNVEFALKRDDIGAEFRTFLKTMVE
ncbi:UTP--glucose-1-phosphate uridylyltransferase [Candidatus Berkelbacteria bacterium]|nr:UTP--glucose-1-phosphate uridylyltransferase [Candidatus Berkelbacteria bacterium]